MPTTFELETLATYFVAEVRDLKAQLKEAERAFVHVEQVANKSAKGVDGVFNRIGGSAIALTASIVGLGSAVSTVFRGVKLAADAEALAVTFRVLVGDVEKADAALRDLEKFALTTPFEMPELMESSKMMLAFGEDVENIVPAMRMLGDVAAGVDQPLKDLAYLLGTLRSQGRAFTVDIRQFASRGIPIYLELAKVLGLVSQDAKKTTTEVRRMMDKMIEAGSVNFEMVEAAFKRMTGPGGQFFGMMEARAKTLKGLFNEMKESIDLSLREIGVALVESLDLKTVVAQITRGTEAFNEFLKNMTSETRETIKIVMVLTAGFVALAAAIFAAGLVFNVMTGGLGIWIGLATVAIAGTTAWAMSVGGLDKAWRRAKRAAQDFNNFLKPIVRALGPLALLIAPVALGIIYLANNWDRVSKSVSEFWRESQPVLRAFWDLVKVVGFALRDSLVAGIDLTVHGIANLGRWLNEVADEIAGVFNNLTVLDQKVIKTLALVAAPISGVIALFRQLGTVTRDEFRDILMLAEYTFVNTANYVKLAMEQAKYHLYGFGLDFAHFFDSTAPTALKWFADNWKALFVGLFQVSQGFVNKFLTMIVDGVASVPDIIAGKVNISDILLKHGNEYRKILERSFEGIKPPTFKGRLVTKQEEEALDRIAKTEFDLTQGFDKFKKERLELWEKQDLYDAAFELGDTLADAMFGIKPEAAQAGAAAGREFAREFGKAAGKWDAVLFDSAEARARIQEFANTLPEIKRLEPVTPPSIGVEAQWREMQRQIQRLPDPTEVDFPSPRAVAPPTLAPAPRMIGSPFASDLKSPRNPDTAAVLGVLLQIAVNTLEIARKPGVIAAPAGLED